MNPSINDVLCALPFSQRFFYDLITKNHKEDNSRNCGDLEERIDAYVTAMVSK